MTNGFGDIIMPISMLINLIVIYTVLDKLDKRINKLENK